MTVAYVVIRPVVALSALGAKIGFVVGRFIGTLVTNLEPLSTVKKLSTYVCAYVTQAYFIIYNLKIFVQKSLLVGFANSELVIKAPSAFILCKKLHLKSR